MKKKLADVLIITPSYNQFLSVAEDLYNQKKISKNSWLKIKRAIAKKQKVTSTIKNYDYKYVGS